MAENLFFCDGSAVEAARAALARGLRIVALSEAAGKELSGAGLPFTRSLEPLGDDPEMPLYRAAADWTKAFGSRCVDESGQTLMDALRYRNTNLWWWAELYLHHNTEAVRRVRFLETVSRVAEHLEVCSVETHGLSADETLLLGRFCAARGLGFRAGKERVGGAPARRSALTAGLLEASKMVATAVKSAGGRDPRLVPHSVVFLSHAAFWRTRIAKDGTTEDYEHYLDSLLAEAGKRNWPTVTLGVGPQSTFRTRSAGEKWKERLSLRTDTRYVHINRFVTPGLAAAALKAFGRAMGVHQRFRTAASLGAAFSHRGVSFGGESSEDLARTLLHQVPWAARSLLEFEAAFEELNPCAVCLYAESSGLGRSAIAAAQARKVKTIGVQHGILYPNYFSYERSVDDLAQGTPMPDITAMYGQDGIRLLEDTFRYPKGRVVATGSPRYDALAAELQGMDREERRLELGLRPGEKLVLLASRYQGIRDTHKASGPVFAGLLSTLRSLEGTRLIVKPHPAEPQDAYDKDIAGAALGDRVRVISDRPLAHLLPAADLLLTVESLSATEALVAGVPVAVLRHPSNLRDLVASGAALGVRDGEDPGAAIRSLLHDPETRSKWAARRAAFLEDVAHGVDGKALPRLMELVSRMAGLD